MLTSNIFKHLRQQNWGAAFIDFSIVVLGIFVAIQVNSWNESRIDRKKEDIILKQLYNEVEKNMGHIQLLANFHKNRASDLEHIINAVATDTINVNSNKAKDPIIKMYQLPPIRVSMGTYNSLVATGEIALIQDPKLKALLFSVDSAIKAEKDYLKYFQQINISDRNYARSLVTLIANKNKTGTEMHVNFALLKEDKNLLKLLNSRRHTHQLFYDIRKDLLSRFEDIKSYIDDPRKTKPD